MSLSHSIRSALALIAAAPAVFGSADARPLSYVFSDHMVLQRDAPIRIWGEAAPGEAVRLRFDGLVRRVEADATGRWEIELPARPASADPVSLAVETEDGDMAVVSDILIGDVLVCSGQSNMEYPVYRALNPDRAAAGPHDGAVRMLTIPKSDDEQATAGWRRQDETSVPSFSAVCHYAGRALKRESDVPLGLIATSWGGSRIAAWMSPEALRATGGHDEALDLLAAYRDDPAAAMEALGDRWESWWTSADGGEPWTPGAADGWRPAPEGGGDWRAWGDEALADHLGMIWLAAEFELPDDAQEGPVALSLGDVDELDATWVNGRFVGATFSWGGARDYEIDAGLLKPGRNTVVVNVYNSWGAGGLTPTEETGVLLADGRRAALAGWRYLKAPAEYGSPPRGPWEPISGIAGLHEIMMKPILGLKASGYIWYQGESDTERADVYADHLRALLAETRASFGADMPAVIIQLANFGSAQFAPGPAGWSAVREAQRRVAVEDPMTGLTVAVDVGDPFDIHPGNKEIVGERAASALLRLRAGDAAGADGPQPERARTSPVGRAVIDFGPHGSDVAAAGGPYLGALQVCRKDGACVSARGEWREGALTVEVPGGRMRRGDLVRYCWGDAPLCPLMDADGVPVSPFAIEIN